MTLNKDASRFDWCGVVRFDSPILLANTRQQAIRHETHPCEALATGFYLALWLAEVSAPSYDHRPRFLGPFASETTANFLETSARALGIVERNRSDHSPRRNASFLKNQQLGRLHAEAGWPETATTSQ